MPPAKRASRAARASRTKDDETSTRDSRATRGKSSEEPVMQRGRRGSKKPDVEEELPKKSARVASTKAAVVEESRPPPASPSNRSSRSGRSVRETATEEDPSDEEPIGGRAKRKREPDVIVKSDPDAASAMQQDSRGNERDGDAKAAAVKQEARANSDDDGKKLGSSSTSARESQGSLETRQGEEPREDAKIFLEPPVLSASPSSRVSRASADSQNGEAPSGSARSKPMTKVQEAALKKKQQVEAEHQREAGLAALAQQEALRYAHEEKIIRQAKIVQKRREGDAIVKKMSRYAEPPRKKTHWDYLLQEMEWLANDYGEERRWKMALAKKVSAAVLKYHKMKKTKLARQKKMEDQNLKKAANRLSKDIKQFWGQVGKLVVYKHEVQIEELRRRNVEKHMDFMVGQTERYSKMLAEDLQGKAPVGKQVASDPMLDPDDIEFFPEQAEDDETTLDEPVDEDLQQAEETAAASLVAESTAPIETLLANYGLDESVFKTGIPEIEAESEAEGKTEKESVCDAEAADKSAAAMTNGDADEKKSAGFPSSTVELDKDAMHTESDELDDDIDLAYLVDPAAKELSEAEKKFLQKKQDRMDRTAASAEELAPAGWTLDTAGQRKNCDVPFIIKANLREYQHVALNWLTSLYDKKLNGILADEMGLGKTLMTISLLAYLALERGVWGPHLIVVPTSVMLNWEIEFKKFCPALKILTYYGTQKERKEKRKGWTQQNFFHVCITSYKLVVQDQHVFRRKAWQYLILDEAHHIKNFQSQRWQTMLGFNTKRRLLLTGTPLQNDLMELWSLMHFLMPHIFASHKEFKDWFSNPLNGMAGDKEQMNKHLVGRLHGVLRPFILRRLKSQVEKQLPSKTEHVVPCPLSPRQRVLYEEYMGRSDTKKSLAGGNYIGIMNVIMQLRKVCNHPDLFEMRPIVSPFDVPAPVIKTSGLVAQVLDYDPFVLSSAAKHSSLACLVALEHSSRFDCGRTARLQTPLDLMLREAGVFEHPKPPPDGIPLIPRLRFERRSRYRDDRRKTLHFMSAINDIRCQDRPIYGWDLVAAVTLGPYTSRKELVTGDGMSRVVPVHRWWQCSKVTTFEKSQHWDTASFTVIRSICKSWDLRFQQMLPIITRCVMTIRKSRSKPAALECGGASIRQRQDLLDLTNLFHVENSEAIDSGRAFEIRKQLYFPDKRLVQFDCGKLQVLDKLLRELKSGGHRCLIFTQMTKMLDVLEHFLNLYGYTYLRLDGATKVEERQKMMDRFNSSSKYFIFILSTRSGGVGINLTGADTVIFYDSDWNPAMDAQAQDRCHRIGQTREVHIYRLISEHTVEENILQKSRQKSEVNRMVLQDGNFNVDAFKKWGSAEVKSLFGAKVIADAEGAQAEVEAAAAAAEAGVSVTTSATSNTTHGSAAESDGETIDVSQVKRAMAGAEDEEDLAAADRAERENAATVEEFAEENSKAPGLATENPIVLESKARREFLLALRRGRQGKDGGAADTKSERLKGSEPVASVEFDWENDLLPIQKYAMNFLLEVYPMVDTKQSVEKLDYEEQEWELDKLQQLKDEEEEKLEEDGELLYYDVAEGGGDNREAELLDLRDKYFAAQHTAYVEMSKQKLSVPHALELGPINPPDLAPDYEDERPDRPLAPPAKSSPSSDAGEKDSTDNKTLTKFSRKQMADTKRKMEQLAKRQKLASAHEVSGDGDGLFNVFGKPSRDRKKPGRVDRRKPSSGDDPHGDEAAGSPWSDKQDLALVYAVSQFGENWMLISEVVSKSRLIGPWRSREHCLARFRSLAQDRQSGLTARKDMMERVTREDARVVCNDPQAVKRFQDLSRCVQKKVRDLFQTLGSGLNNTGPTPTHQSHVTVMQKAIPDLSKPPRNPEEIPPPATPSLPLRRRENPLKRVQDSRSSTKPTPRSSSGMGRGPPISRTGYASAAQYKQMTQAQKRKAQAAQSPKKGSASSSPRSKKTKAQDYGQPSAESKGGQMQMSKTSGDPGQVSAMTTVQIIQQLRHAEAQRATHHRLAVAAHESVQRTHEAKQAALQHHEAMQSGGSSEQITKARLQHQQTAEAYNAAQMQHRNEYRLYQEWTARVQAFQTALNPAQQRK